jgi:2-oxoglutarate ferredoxin oxidoreductase subunit alpha
MVKNTFTLHVATVNGSGSQSSNNVLVRSLFRLGLPVGGKNLFPSNIQGLPTWYTIRVDQGGFTSRLSSYDILLGMNQATFEQDQEMLKSGGHFFYNGDFKLVENLVRKDVVSYAIPFRSLTEPLSKSAKLRKLLTNMVYAGVISRMLSIPEDTIKDTVRHQFAGKDAVIDSNIAAIEAGRRYADENLQPDEFPIKVEAITEGNRNKILIDGNTASAMGLMDSGCSFVAWYPITPSSSLVESFERFARTYKKDSDGKATYAVVQGEDELSSICMVIGAGWAGARAMTATSGPGISLMAEAAGLAYFAEIPAVIWDVQRVGPSTGLPTRTMQGDLLAAYTLSHGDTKHMVLLPQDPKECFEFARVAFDIADELQTLVFVLTDLDIGMNQHIVDRLEVNPEPLKRGKVLTAEQLEKLGDFARYKDVDGDGIGYRTLPGTQHDLAAYFTRGTGHDEKALYSENNDIFKANMDRLLRKLETAKKIGPQPEVINLEGAKAGIIYYGSTAEAMREGLYLLQSEAALTLSQLRVKALPLSHKVREFI